MTNKLVAKRLEILGWLALIALQYPILSLFSSKFVIYGIPLLHWYVLLVWLAIIIRLFFITKRLSKTVEAQNHE